MRGLGRLRHTWRAVGAAILLLTFAPAADSQPNPGSCQSPPAPQQPLSNPPATPAQPPHPVNPVHGASMANASADMSSKLIDLPTGPVSTTLSTYGTPITTDAAARAAYAKLAAGAIVRIPLQWNSGAPCSSAGGGHKHIPADDWITAITAMGARAMIVIGGSNGNNFSATDAADLVKRYHHNLYAVVIGNEPDDDGMSMPDYLRKVFIPAARAIRAADPAVKIAGPAQASYKPGDLHTFITQAKGLYDIIDYHQYGTGTDAPDNTTLMAAPDRYSTEITAIRGWLDTARQNQVEIQVGEFNLAWQYTDGIPGGDTRFFTAYNTAWSASAIGHILRAGGRAVAYSQQNGPLGLMVQPGDHDNGHPDTTPQPLYHGLGMFTGEGLFTGFGTATMNSTTNSAAVDCFAGNTGNIVIVNKADADTTVTLTVTGAADGRKTVWVSNTGDPYAAPIKTATILGGGTATLTLDAYQVATVITGAGTSSRFHPQQPLSARR